MTEPNSAMACVKRLLRKMIARVDHLLWRDSDASARSAGLQITKATWRSRVYRDPRFDRLPKDRHIQLSQDLRPGPRHDLVLGGGVSSARHLQAGREMPFL
jgi:hypothetical protein